MKIGLFGRSGKMGQRLELLAKVVSEDADVIIDFSSPKGTMSAIEWALEEGCPLVIGTTGHNEGQLETIQIAANRIPVLHAANFSPGIWRLIRAAKEMGPGYRMTMKEIHHAEKRDSPSGTAKLIAKMLDYHNMPISSIRAGEIVGEHEITFRSKDEEITIRHRAVNRDLFANGALLAADFLINQPAGFYTFEDALRCERIH